jgi:hypothetical protein
MRLHPSLTTNPGTYQRYSGHVSLFGRVEDGRGLGQSRRRFPSPLIKPDVRVSRIRLSGWLHRVAHGGGPKWTRRRRRTPSAPNTASGGKRRCRARAPCDGEPGSTERGDRHDCPPPATPACDCHSRNTCSSPRNRRLSRTRTSGQVPMLPGTRMSLTLALSRNTLFWDGLAPRYQWPSCHRGCLGWGMEF